MKRRNADIGKLRRPIKRNKITESFYGRCVCGLFSLNMAACWQTNRWVLELLCHLGSIASTLASAHDITDIYWIYIHVLKSVYMHNYLILGSLKSGQWKVNPSSLYEQRIFSYKLMFLNYNNCLFDNDR